MKIASALLFYFILVTGLSAQVGLNVAYGTFDQAVIGTHVGESDAPQKSGVVLSLDYWFRLKQKRLEFLPTIYYANYGGSYEVTNYGFQFRTTIYPFDLAGDCNCPTFSKENELLKKGFFIRLAPGIGNWSASVASIPVFEDRPDYDSWVPEIGGAVGLDIGVSNLITISPEIRLRRIFGSTWDEVPEINLDGFTLIEPAVRIGMRFDEKNYGFKTRRRRRR